LCIRHHFPGRLSQVATVRFLDAWIVPQSRRGHDFQQYHFPISYNTPGGVLFPGLEPLYWDTRTAHSAVAFFRLFPHPRLKSGTLSIDIGSPLGQPAATAQIIVSLSTSLDQPLVISRQGEDLSAIQFLRLFVDPGRRLWVPFSEKTIRHLTQLPNLYYWKTAQGPPLAIPTFTSPSLEQLRLPNQRLYYGFTFSRRTESMSFKEVPHW